MYVIKISVLSFKNNKCTKIILHVINGNLESLFTDSASMPSSSIFQINATNIVTIIMSSASVLKLVLHHYDFN